MDAPLPVGLVSAWEEFLGKPRELDDLFVEPTLFPLQRRREMEAMFAVAAEHPVTTYMEIGADKGGSVWAWLHRFPSLRRVIACEVRGTPYAAAFERAFPHVSFLWLPQSSYAPHTVETVRRWLRGPGESEPEIDCLFIDGDKLQFVRDFDLYSPLVARSGTVFVHDIRDTPGPRDAWLEIRSRFAAYREILDISESEEAVAREKAGVPSASVHEGWLRHWHGRSCGVGVVRIGE